MEKDIKKCVKCGVEKDIYATESLDNPVYMCGACVDEEYENYDDYE